MFRVSRVQHDNHRLDNCSNPRPCTAWNPHVACMPLWANSYSWKMVTKWLSARTKLKWQACHSALPLLSDYVQTSWLLYYVWYNLPVFPVYVTTDNRHSNVHFLSHLSLHFSFSDCQTWLNKRGEQDFSIKIWFAFWLLVYFFNVILDWFVSFAVQIMLVTVQNYMLWQN